MPLVFPGPRALSEFRRIALLERCRQVCSPVAHLETRYEYLVQLEDQTEVDVERLRAVLGLALPRSDASASCPGSGPSIPDTAAGVVHIVIAPRPGTISPWSSKATDILHNCGFAGVARVECGTRYSFSGDGLTRDHLGPAIPLLFDRMTEAEIGDPSILFAAVDPRPVLSIPVLQQGRQAMDRANAQMGLALPDDEVDYLLECFARLDRDPTDVELVMFANVNSEHCRHKIFNADWAIDGQQQERSLFDMIRHTHAQHPDGTVTAYADNAGVIEGFTAAVLRPDPAEHTYRYHDRQTHILIKVETHNHPTAISPYPGAATGVGGEIRDENATGRGGASQAGLCGFFVSHLRIPGFAQPWERDLGEPPSRLATPLEIMTEGPIGGAAFGNEFGRPNILGVFRTCEELVAGRHRGYHKPIMVAGGSGLIDAEQVKKNAPEKGDYVIQIGGPAMLIGLGGGYASSMDTGSNLEDLDFASVQRDNPEMQRRCHELICRCFERGAGNPIVSIHDCGAGGLSNACPELVEETGARFDLRAVKNDDPGMSPMELWCNEAQERYVLVIRRHDLEQFAAMAARERCLYAVIGEVSADGILSLTDGLLGNSPIDDLPLEVILGKPPRMLRDVVHLKQDLSALDLGGVDLRTAAQRVLRFPAVAAKTFLITIADRTVTGLIARDQMVGPYQTPISDLAVTATSFQGHTGTAMAMGERTPLALIHAPASARMAVAEAITNLAGACIGAIGRIKLSANWMCACGEEGEDALLYDTVRAVGMEFCPEAGVAIPVGKDSLSMRTVWEDSQGASHTIVAPLSLVISAFAPVEDIRATVTSDLKPVADSRLLLIDLGHGLNRLGGSSLAQVHGQIGDCGPDVDPVEVRHLFEAIQTMVAEGLLLAYHDRSDGGLFTTAAEMAFGSLSGVRLDISDLGDDPLAALYTEEIGALLQYRSADADRVRTIVAEHDLAACAREVGHRTDTGRLEIASRGQVLFAEPTAVLKSIWAELTYQMQARRDNPECAREEHESIADVTDPGMSFATSFDVGGHAPAPSLGGARPRLAVLREQGINGHMEMAAAFDAAGFETVDVMMTDLIEGRTQLDDFGGLVACGGFSYGDVLGAGAGWARTILFHSRLREMFTRYFERPDSFSLGVCNGCQMLSLLRELIPGTEGWPSFVRNRSEQFEARLVTVEIMESNSVLLAGMAGSRLPVPCAHGEGRAEFGSAADLARLCEANQVGMRFVDNDGRPAERYPLNPNGSPGGVTGLSSADGRVTVMMPHPERVFRNVQLSYRPDDWAGEYSPWIQLFRNARRFADS